jgi:hypothetical protein
MVRLIDTTPAQVSHYRPSNQVDQGKSRYRNCRQAVIKIHNGKVTLVVKHKNSPQDGVTEVNRH